MDKEAEKSIKRELKGVTAELDTGAKKGFGLAPRVKNLSEQRSWTNAAGPTPMAKPSKPHWFLLKETL